MMTHPQTLAEACSEMYNDSDRLSQCTFYQGAMKAVQIIMETAEDEDAIRACKRLVDEVAGWLEERYADVP